MDFNVLIAFRGIWQKHYTELVLRAMIMNVLLDFSRERVLQLGAQMRFMLATRHVVQKVVSAAWKGLQEIYGKEMGSVKESRMTQLVNLTIKRAAMDLGEYQENTSKKTSKSTVRHRKGNKGKKGRKRKSKR